MTTIGLLHPGEMSATDDVAKTLLNEAGS
jgi:hypothetical protein